MSQTIARLIRKLQQSIDWAAPAGTFQPTASVRDQSWENLLRIHNGLAAFKGGLRIFGTTTSLLPSIDEWNRDSLWRSEYRGLDGGLTFFAEDVFGNQFGFDENGGVVRFLAEIGDREVCGRNAEEWLEKILADPSEELSLWLLGEWLQQEPELKLTEHLCPKTPFVAQGQVSPSNLYACGRVESMRFKGSFAHQIRNVPTGGKIEIKVR